MNVAKHSTILITVLALCVTSSSLAQEATNPQESENSTDKKETARVRGLSIDKINQESTAIFEYLDGDDSGTITVEELWNSPADLGRREASRRMSAIRIGFPPVEAQVDVFDVSDTDGDGVLSKHEYEQRADSVRKHKLELAFKNIDSNVDGNVDLSEFNERADKLAEWDENEDGILGRTEVDRDFWREANRVPGLSRVVSRSRWGPRMRSSRSWRH